MNKPVAGSKRAAPRFSRRGFMVRSAAGIAGAAMSSLGFPWGDLAYGQQVKGKPAKFNVAVRPDWTQGWFGVINEEKQIWKKYLPEGSEVTFTHPIQGGIVTNELIAQKTMIGHNGDAPGLIATFQRNRADIRAIGLIGSSPSGYHCYQILARTDAPEFKDSKEALRWFDGRVVATPKGSCSDRFFQDVFKREGIKPKEYLNQPIGVITTNLRAKKIDGAATWDPQGAAVSTIAGEGIARIVATGQAWGERDSGTIVARKDFIDENPEIVKAWLKAEIETQMWYYDPRNHAEVLKIAANYVTGFSEKSLWFSLAGLIPEPYFGGPIRDEKLFVWNDEVHALQKRVLEYLAQEKIIPSSELLPGAIDDSLARQAMKEMNVSSPLVRLKAIPIEQGYPLFQDPKKIEEYAALFKI
ncbi:MAG: sulfonate transport system substrate-binding protein [Alphaproteobacteria bacterium]|jgi:NitT/TauT family transport system substrate-binding protein|nr:sulfonate transport system substrate-binding protein [Alphaproteobacteria bacterium]MEA2963552.1 sulfonate transport system substrate-binding protein [Alphaproteobacteria bacterium]